MIKINSELPVQLLSRNIMLNDYDFVLLHLFESNEEYRKYFLNLRATRPDRKMILDNSAYEYFIKGQELNMDEFVSTIKFLTPDYYILPDTLMNKEKTLSDVENFINKYSSTLNSCGGWSVPIAVLQGNSRSDLLECAYKYNDMGINHIAIPFHNSFFKEDGSEEHYIQDEIYQKVYGRINDDILYAKGRFWFLKTYENVLKQFKYVHLLGSHCPLEKALYEEYKMDFIDSMDTGYPVKCAMEGYELYKEPHKPNIIIDDFVDSTIYVDTRDLIMKNIFKFKNNIY